MAGLENGKNQLSFSLTISIALATTGFNNFLLRSSHSMTFPVYHDLGLPLLKKAFWSSILLELSFKQFNIHL